MDPGLQMTELFLLTGKGPKADLWRHKTRRFGRVGPSVLADCSHRRRKLRFKTPAALRLDPLVGKVRGVNPDEDSEAGIAKAVSCRLQHLTGNSCCFSGPKRPSSFLLDLRGGGSAVWPTTYSPYQLCPGLCSGEDTPTRLTLKRSMPGS